MKELTVLFCPFPGMGHINACLGLAEAVRGRGHRVIIITEKRSEGKIAGFGFEECVYDESVVPGQEDNQHWTKTIFDDIDNVMKDPNEYFEWLLMLLKAIFMVTKRVNHKIREIVDKIKPDIIIDEYTFPLPGLIVENIPVIKFLTTNPLYALSNERLPPPGFGLPLNDTSEWQPHREKIHRFNETIKKQTIEWLNTENVPIPKREYIFMHLSTNLNIYLYPQAMAAEYLQKRNPDEEWIGLDHSLRKPVGNFKISDTFVSLPGKTIYFSLGSLGSSIVPTMKRLVSILSKSQHKFIVCRGNNQEAYDLATNMWGEAFLPQLDVLPLVDLVITHGGNNTFVETLYFGKPMIVLPLFGDQHDNAQRAVETKVGYKFNPFTVGEELCEAIDRLLSDQEILSNVKRISNQMQNSDSMDKVVDRIEFVARNPKFPTVY